MRTVKSTSSRKGVNKGMLVAHAFHFHGHQEAAASADAAAAPSDAAAAAPPANMLEKIAKYKYWPIVLALASEFAVHMLVHLIVEGVMHLRGGHSHAPCAAATKEKAPCPHCGKKEDEEKEA